MLLECTGVQSVRHDACLSVLSGGRAIMIGVGEQVGGFPMSAVIEREVTIHGVMRYKFTACGYRGAGGSEAERRYFDQPTFAAGARP